MTKIENLISAEISTEEAAALIQQVNAIREKLPFLVGLTPEERVSLGKPGQKMLAALDGVAAAAEENPDFFPKVAFDPAELRRDLALIRALEPLHDAVSSLQEALSDTLLAARSDSYRNGLQGYALAKAALRYVPGLAALVEALRSVFDRVRKRPAAPSNG